MLTKMRFPDEARGRLVFCCVGLKTDSVIIPKGDPLTADNQL